MFPHMLTRPHPMRTPTSVQASTYAGHMQKEPINDKNNETTTPAKKKCPILPTFHRKEGAKSTCKIKVAKCCECLSDCRMLCSFEDLDSITIFAMVSVIGGTIFFIAVLVVLTVVHVI